MGGALATFSRSVSRASVQSGSSVSEPEAERAQSVAKAAPSTGCQFSSAGSKAAKESCSPSGGASAMARLTMPICTRWMPVGVRAPLK
ncbi:hypothetical protein [Teichococcus aestuarii]|uniref:hypothetical protein n=1 Tax=Teichococcus aestuarii TaxID=568898 RepID=UPI003605FB0C